MSIVTLKIPKKDYLYFDGKYFTNGKWLLDLSVGSDLFKINGEYGGLVKAEKPFCFQNKQLVLEKPRKAITLGSERLMADARNAEAVPLTPTKLLMEGEKNSLFQMIRREGVKRELPLLFETIRWLSCGRIIIKDKRVYLDDKECIGGVRLNKQIERIVESK